VTTFNYTTGNPNNLTGGSAASMVDIQGPFTDLKTFLNGNIDGTNAPSLETAFSTWKVIKSGALQIPTQGAGGNFPAPANVINTLVVYATSGTGAWAFRLDPADFNAGSRVTKLRLRTTLIANSIASTANFVSALQAVSSFGGGASTIPAITGAGATVASNTHTTPAGASVTTIDSTEVNFPAAGMYHFSVGISGAMAATSTVSIYFELQMRQV
jgi:hypothetical protein